MRHAAVSGDLGDLGDRRSNPRGQLESELVDAKTVGNDVVESMPLSTPSSCRKRWRFVSRGRRERENARAP
jgi:hypothetical protein